MGPAFKGCRRGRSLRDRRRESSKRKQRPSFSYRGPVSFFIVEKSGVGDEQLSALGGRYATGAERVQDES